MESPPVTENSTEKPRVPLTQLPQERHPAEPQCETTTGHRASCPPAPPAALSCPHPPPSTLNPWGHDPVLRITADVGAGTRRDFSSP